MGATLVAQAINWAPNLSDRAFRVLVCMALTAKDNATPEVPAKLYFGGQQPLVRVLTRTRGGTNDTAIKTVKRAISELINAGAIRLSRSAVANANAVYLLTLDNPQTIRTRESETLTKPLWITQTGGTTQVPLGGTPEVPLGGTPEVQPGGHRKSPPIRNQEEPLEELKEDYGVDLPAQLAPTRDTSNAEKPENHHPNSPSKCGDPTCQLGYTHNPTAPKGHRNPPCPTCRPKRNTK